MSRSLLALYLLLFSVATRADELRDFGRDAELAACRNDAQALLIQRQVLMQRTQDPAAAGKYVYYYLGYADYQLANLYSMSDKSKASGYIDQAEDALQAALTFDRGFAEAEALLGSSYGVEISLHPWKGIWLGAKSSERLQHAAELAPDNPRVQLLLGIADYLTPAKHGGDRERAMVEYRRALLLFDSEPLAGGQTPDWGRATAHAWLGQSEVSDGDWVHARADFEAAVDLAPDYKFAQAGLARLPTDPAPSSATDTATPPAKPPRVLL